MTSAAIRTARPGDHAAIVAVADAWWGRPISHILPRLFLDHFAPTSLFAEDTAGTAGFLVGFDSPAAADAAYIHMVAVRPDLRRSGLAAGLYGRFLAGAAERGRPVVRAVTSPVNTGSIAFHRAMGFAVTGPVADYDGPGLDRMVFERRG
ncbi:GNAT family N-acetyltransferase [Nocardiopsis sediminis]|uniref:GNAT family N-acetyltransferase n=1 Tax=Nocardiopsis sediminis TaxID=1778267 RepID=A0ABV8FTX0_9ACTN